MSVFSAKTGVSILKRASTDRRENAKRSFANSVRFELPKEKGVKGIIESVQSVGNYVAYNDFTSFLQDGRISDNDFIRVVSEARQNVHLLNPEFGTLVEALISLPWRQRPPEAIAEYTEFFVELLVAHNKYASFAVSKLLSNWIPGDNEAQRWKDACPDEALKIELESVHNLLDRVLNIIPMTYDVVLDSIERLFPYFKKPPHVAVGFLHNVLWLSEYRPTFTNAAINLIFKNLLQLDVNAPRNEIEDAEFEDEEADDATMFKMDECGNDDTVMRHPVAEALDVCMEKMLEYIRNYVEPENSTNFRDIASIFKIFFDVFEDVVLPSHNTHHVQFLMFYFCSFKPFLAERFLINLWNKVTNPNVSAPTRQASVGYIASFLARSKNVPFGMLKNYLAEMCSWAHSYIERTDPVRTNNSFKANLVFFSVCQGIFYVIAFRSKHLTCNKKGLLFLQSLQLSALVTCSFNPLRVCIPAVATAFAGVTRTYQLAYCHAILERNARRKLATVYANEVTLPEEFLDTIFPFDPCLLKKSGQRITPIYLQYQASEAEEDTVNVDANIRRKRGDSEVDDIDDFIVDKKQKCSELSRSHEREMQFTYGLSPGFHT